MTHNSITIIAKHRRAATIAAWFMVAFFAPALAASDFQPGMQAYERGDYTAAVLAWRSLAEKGDALAGFIVGFMYADGKGVPQDFVEVHKWFGRAPTKDPTPEHMETVRRLFRNAAEQGDALAQFFMGLLSGDGKGGVDSVEAAKWLRKAAEQGHALSQYFLGNMYRKGDGLSQNHTEAVKLFRKASAKGLPWAQLVLGDMYRDGDGVPQDPAEAAKWFRKAADQGAAEAQFSLGNLYTEGMGVPQDYSQAKRWYRLAAEQGHDGAQKALKAELAERGLELSPSDRRLIQMGLVDWGFDPGDADGLFGPKTRKAIRSWQSLFLPKAATGYLDAESAKMLLASGRELEARENVQRQPATTEHRRGEKQATKEIWRCFATNDYNKTTALFTLTREKSLGDELAEVLVAGTAHGASFEVAGLNRRWDFGYDAGNEKFLYAFIIKPDGTGLYYDFSMSPDGRASPRDSFKCLMSP